MLNGQLLFETYKNFIPHGKYMFKTAYYMDMVKFGGYPSSNYALSHCKFLLHCCVKCPCIDLPSPESDQQNSNASPTICFHVYKHIEGCTVHVRRPFNEKKQFQLRKASTDSIVSAKSYTKKIM